MKKIVTILVFIAICKFSNGQSNYYPIEKGATFTYAYGNELYDGSYSKMRSQISILNTTKIIDGKEYFMFETSSGSEDNYSVIASSYARVGEDGSIFALEKEGNQEYLTLKTPLKLGATWSSKSGQLTSTIKVINLDGTIKTANTTYANCLVVEQKTEDERIMRSYFKEGIGMVATTMIVDDSEKVFIYLVNE